jgi:CO/xanthine dehydrogenase FAD-binding subunit
LKPAPFEYVAPGSLDEALSVLEKLGEDAKILAGGQSLVPLLNLRLARPGHLVDINRLRELDYLRPLDAGGLAVGALTRHRSLERSTVAAAHAPLWSEAAPLIGDRQVRFRGTVGGSLAHADPSSELPTVAVATEAEIVVRGPRGERTIAAADFFAAALMTVLEPDELLVEVRIPAAPAGAGHAFLELARRHGDFALVSAAASVVVTDGRVTWVRIALGGVAPTPLRATRAEASLLGESPTSVVLARAGRLAAEDTDPGGDMHGSPEYRRDVAAVYVERALDSALRRAAGHAGGA